MLRKLCGLAVLSVMMGATPALAQGPGVEVEPYIGFYLPTMELVELDVSGFAAEQKEGLAAGGRLTLWLFGPLGVEGNLIYAFSDADVEQGGVVQQESAGVWTADARLIFKLLPGPIGFHVNGGIALIGRTGDAYDAVQEGKTDVGGAAGVGLRINLPGLFGIRGDVDAYIYKAELTAGGVTFASQFQFDLVASAGLVIRL